MSYVITCGGSCEVDASTVVQDQQQPFAKEKTKHVDHLFVKKNMLEKTASVFLVFLYIYIFYLKWLHVKDSFLNVFISVHLYEIFLT